MGSRLQGGAGRGRAGPGRVQRCEPRRLYSFIRSSLR